MHVTDAEEPPINIRRDRLVITASALGTVFEWYDFFLYGILAALIGKLFFPIDNPTAATLASLAAFGAGFGVRPLGAMIFGHYGDRIGRKYTFLVTITLMGGATAAIGMLPTYAQVGLWAPALLVILRLLQGLALGGEYGGAAIYVGEHAPRHRRGEYTSWIQISVVGGFLLCLIVVLAVRGVMTEEQFEAWGWRIPFLLSILMLAISIYIRMKLSESPVFQAMKEAGTTSRNPIVDAFSDRKNIGNVLVALFGVAAGLTVIYYTSQFGTLYFLTGTAGVSEREALMYLAAGALVAAPLYVGFGMLSDRIGRKKLLLAGYALSLIFIFPLFHLMASGANPALARATAQNPVVLELPECDFSVFARTQTEPCAKALGYLTKRGIAYSKVAAPDLALVVGGIRVEGFDRQAFTDALKAAGYPERANPDEKQHWKIILAIFAMVTLSAMTYGQVAAILVELFPSRVRYTSMSVPYHIGTGYFGGFLPFIQQLIVVNTGNPFAGLWYTVVVVAMALVVTAIWLPETRGRDIRF
ncbi:MAG: MHS family MFS transporter [Sandarakinorhabdus sp.]|nr:MHS family MFS transporter [Sandarakinorhabdus sp.]